MKFRSRLEDRVFRDSKDIQNLVLDNRLEDISIRKLVMVKILKKLFYKGPISTQMIIPDCEIVNVANQFREAAIILNNYPENLLETGVISPFLTNAALSLELYLKSLDTQQIYKRVEDFGNRLLEKRIGLKPLIQLHSLTKIFDNIDSDIKKKIREAYKNLSLKQEYPQIEQLLKKYNNLFLHSRYPFQAGNKISGCNITQLMRLIDFFHEFVNNMPQILLQK